MQIVRRVFVAAVFPLAAVNAAPAWAQIDFSGET